MGVNDNGAPDAVIEINADNDASETPVVETGDTTVIVETPVETPGTEIDPFTERFVRLEARVDDIQDQLYGKADFQAVEAIAEGAADDALEEALAVDEEIVAATDDAIVETVEGAEIDDIDDDGDDEIITDEIAPLSAKVHPLFRSRQDWKNR